MTDCVHKRKEFQKLKIEWNLPIALTASRFFIIPLQVYFLVQGQPFEAFCMYFLAFFTDWIDGFLARKLDLRTAFGAWLDPLADKVTLMATFITLVYIQVIPFWLALIVVARDVLIIVFAAILYFRRIRVSWSSIYVGKSAATVQYSTVLAFILYHFYKFPYPFLMSLVGGTVILTLYSSYEYYRLFCNYFRNRDSTQTPEKKSAKPEKVNKEKDYDDSHRSGLYQRG